MMQLSNVCNLWDDRLSEARDLRYKKLLIAYKTGNITLLREILDIDPVPKQLRLLMKKAAADDNLNIIKLLVEYGADINYIYDDGDTILMTAAANGYMDILDYILENGADINICSNKHNNDYGATALMLACMNGQTDVVDRLLKEPECDINIKNKVGSTALTYAVIFGQNNIIDKLIINGADINTTNSSGDNLLCVAALNKNADMMIKLINMGCNVNHQNHNGLTPLIYLCNSIYPTLNLIELLFNNSSEVDVNICDNTGSAALTYASKHRFKDRVEFLLQKGADASQQCTDEETNMFVFTTKSLPAQIVFSKIKALLGEGGNPGKCISVFRKGRHNQRYCQSLAGNYDVYCKRCRSNKGKSEPVIL